MNQSLDFDDSTSLLDMLYRHTSECLTNLKKASSIHSSCIVETAQNPDVLPYSVNLHTASYHVEKAMAVLEKIVSMEKVL